MARKIRRSDRLEAKAHVEVVGELLNVVLEQVEEQSIRSFDALVCLACIQQMSEPGSSFKRRDVISRLQSMEPTEIAGIAPPDSRELILGICSDQLELDAAIATVKGWAESTFRTEWVTGVLNPLLELTCRKLSYGWRVTAALTKTRNQSIYRLKWYSKLKTRRSEPLMTIPRGSRATASAPADKPDYEPIGGSDGSDPWTLHWPSFSELITTSSSMEGLLSGALFDGSNIRCSRNLKIKESLLHGNHRELALSAQIGLSDVVDELISDLARFHSPRSQSFRFVCTNTTVEQLGLGSWESEQSLRRLMSRTGEMLSKSTLRFSCVRVFIIRNPLTLLEPPRFGSFFRTIEENREIGVEPVIYLADRLPPACSYQFSDFYSLSGLFAFVSVVPVYLLRKFRHDGTDTDRLVVKHYTDISDLMLAEADSANYDHAIRWDGGSIEMLRGHIEAMSTLSSKNEEAVMLKENK